MNATMRDLRLADETALTRALIARVGLDQAARRRIEGEAADLVCAVRAASAPTMMESFLEQYGLSTAEGVGLMCLAEALLRVPDARTIDELIKDKIEASNWSVHLGRSSSPLVNASTWALMITGRVLDDDPFLPAAALRGLVRRAGEPVVRAAVGQAMRMLGKQFVLGETIEEAITTASTLEAKGYFYSYDMLGEAARTFEDAERYDRAYRHALDAAAAAAKGDVRRNPGLSVKLSALHPRYEWTHRDAVLDALTPKLIALAEAAAAAGLGLNVDAEEQDRLELSLDVIERALASEALAAWDGFGVVVQAYGKRAGAVIERLDRLAERLGRKIMVRLVKGAYWDAEIKLAQEFGDGGFPVFTRKAATDVSYLACARQLLDKRARIYPQFATHNAHSAAAILEMAGADRASFEFQRLHGMGEALHEQLRQRAGTRCRIYAPVGAHEDLLAYLVRRLLENGANSSFVHQIVDGSIPPEHIARDPIDQIDAMGDRVENPHIRKPAALFGAERPAARGWRLNEPASIEPLLEAREAFAAATWRAAPLLAAPLLASDARPEGAARAVFAPSEPQRRIGEVVDATPAEIARALDDAQRGARDQAALPVAARAAALRRAALLYEENAPELCALLAREAGKTLADAIAEIREAVDFLRYYALEAEAFEEAHPTSRPRGVFLCISPWNFPLAIFTGQIAAALAAGCAVLAKPAEQTPLIAGRGVELLREAGVDPAALQLLPGDGPTVGGALAKDPRLAGVCFTGSTEVAAILHRALADNAGAEAVLIAETGGLNAMLVDSTALTEQAVRDILASAFQSAGQRCSALRMLYVQKDAKDRLLTMLEGAMRALVIGDPWALSTDVGPVIDREARALIEDHVEKAREAGRLRLRLDEPERGVFAAPAVIDVDGVDALEREVFGPILHVADFEARDIEKVVDAVNARGYGLTFGLHTRIDDRVQAIVERLRVGNAYVNRNQIGAVVGSQPFGGEGLSGAGPKAGGPLYLGRFRQKKAQTPLDPPEGRALERADLERALAALAPDRDEVAAWAARDDRVSHLREALGADGARQALNEAAAFDPGPFTLPGPTGETNRLSLHPKGVALCLGPTLAIAKAQAVQALAAGCSALICLEGARAETRALRHSDAPIQALEGVIDPALLRDLQGLAVVAAAGGGPWQDALRRALAARAGPIIVLETEALAPERYYVERHLCVDTTAAGGNASLLASAE